MIHLRDYQQEALDALRAKLGAGTRRIVMVAPTGAGKTTIAGAMIHGAMSKGRRCIFLAHRKELIDQCSSRLDDFGISHGIIQQKHKRTDPRKPVQVASVQTLIRKDHWDADLIIVDECHRSTSKTYTKILERYTNRPAVIGLTATPYRLDGRGLGEIYEDIHPVATCQNLIDLEHLVMPIIYGAPDVDLSAVKVTAGDYNKKDLAAAMKEVVFRGGLVDNWVNRVKAETGAKTDAECRACTVIFAPSVELSIKLTEQFLARGIAAAHIDAKTPAKEREDVLRRLRSRTLSVVSNVGLLTEGWDLPHLECVVLVRPTRSRSLYKQMVGRLMRPDSGKRFAIVLDHANCTKMHGFVNEREDYTLDGREKRTRKGESKAPHKTCRQCEALLPLQTKVCPSCGSVQFIVDIKFTEEELIKLDPSKFKKAEQVPQSERQAAFEELCKQCVAREFKPNWARVRYQKIYAEWPAWNVGIRVPRFFRSYEEDFHKSKILADVADITAELFPR